MDECIFMHCDLLLQPHKVGDEGCTWPEYCEAVGMPQD